VTVNRPLARGLTAYGNYVRVTATVTVQEVPGAPPRCAIASPANGVTPDVPWENLAALFEALDQYSCYRR
jgi:hypothetical protein